MNPQVGIFPSWFADPELQHCLGPLIDAPLHQYQPKDPKVSQSYM